MNKTITIPNSNLEKKVKVLGVIMFDLTTSEQALICKLINASLNNVIALTIDSSTQIRGDMSGSSFNTGVFRLKKRGAIQISGKTITLHPIFNNIDKLDNCVFTFQSPIVFIEDANS